jgi:hypothetical protein
MLRQLITSGRLNYCVSNDPQLHMRAHAMHTADVYVSMYKNGIYSTVCRYEYFADRQKKEHMNTKLHHIDSQTDREHTDRDNQTETIRQRAHRQRAHRQRQSDRDNQTETIRQRAQKVSGR